MTITLKIPNSQEKELREIASQRGQDPEEYAAAVAAIQGGIEAIEAGRYRPAAQVFADMEARHGIPS